MLGSILSSQIQSVEKEIHIRQLVLSSAWAKPSSSVRSQELGQEIRRCQGTF